MVAQEIFGVNSHIKSVCDGYAEGGYEVTHACRVDPGAGQMIEAEAARLLGELERASIVARP